MSAEHINQTWRTPRWFYAWADAQHRFNLDAAAGAGNAFCARFFDREANALEQDWSQAHAGAPVRAFVNPPFGLAHAFAPKVKYEASRGVSALFLAHAAVSSDWFYENVVCGASIVYLVHGRIGYEDPVTGEERGSNDRDSMFAIYLPFSPLAMQEAPIRMIHRDAIRAEGERLLRAQGLLPAQRRARASAQKRKRAGMQA